MGRRRRRIVRVLKKTLPKVFMCPQCGMTAVRVRVKEGGLAVVACGSCNLSFEQPITGGKEPIDVYNQFVDMYIAKRG